MSRRRWSIWARVALWGGLVLVALPAGLLVALNTAPVRERIRLGVSEALTGELRGTFRIDRIGAVSLGGVDGVDARVLDEGGGQVARLQGLRARASLLELAYQLLLGGDEPRVDLTLVQIDFADVRLSLDEAGQLELANAFLPEEDGPASTASGGPRVAIESVRCERLWVHGVAAEGLPVDAELLSARVRVGYSTTSGANVALQGAELFARGLPLALDPRGRLSGVVAVPPSAPTRLDVAFRGQALSSPAELDLRLVGDALSGRARLAQIPAAVVQGIAGPGVRGDATLVAEVEGTLPELSFAVALGSLGGQLEASGRAVVSDGRELQLVARLRDVDLSQLVAGAPRSRLEASLHASFLEADEGDFIGAHRLEVAPGSLADHLTPALAIDGRDAWLAGTLRSRGVLSLAEPGVVASGAYDVTLRPDTSGTLAASLNGRVIDPPRLSAWGLRTRGALSASGTIGLNGGGVAGAASMELDYLRRRNAQVRDVKLEARLNGTSSQPRLRATAAFSVLSGSVRARLDAAPERRQLGVSARNLVVGELSRLAGLELPPQIAAGKVELDATVTQAARVSDPLLELRGRADFGELGTMELSAHELGLPRGDVDWGTLGALRGSAVLRGAVGLDQASPLLAEAGLTLGHLSGALRFELSTLGRGVGGDGAEVSLRVDTHGLRVVEERAPRGPLTTTDQAVAARPLALEGVDFHLALRSSPRTAETVGTLLVRDPGGTLLELQAETRLPGRWYRDLAGAAAWKHHPLRLRLLVPERRLNALPARLRQPDLRGTIAVEASLDGTLAEPRAAARIRLGHVRSLHSDEPLDVSAEVDWSSRGGKLQLAAASSRTGVEVANVGSTWRGDVQRAVVGEAPLPLVDLVARLRDFPLHTVPALVERQVAGKLSGELSLEGWGGEPRLEARLVSHELSLAKVPVQKLNVRALAGGEQLQLAADIEAGSGVAQAKLGMAMLWGARPWPSLQRTGELSVDARDFRVETLGPVLRDYVSELTGVLQASTRLAFAGDKTSLSGTLSFRDGTLQIPAIGQRFTEVTARVVATDNRLDLKQLSASGTTGRVSIEGSAQLAEFELREAEARLTIARGESFPVTLEGVELGDAWGNLVVRYATLENGERSLLVRAPRLYLSMPETNGYDLQSLEPAQDVYVGVRRADGKFVALPTQPLEPGGEAQADSEGASPLRIVIELGDDVVLERGRSVEAQLTGRLAVLVSDATEVEGRIEVRRGKLDVQGKSFEIERGIITFAGDDPANPDVVATARWDAPGYAVYADYSGDVQNGRIRLRAEPPLSQDELANLLLFGSPEASAGTSGNSAGAGALAFGVVGETAARGLTKALDDFTNLDVSARVDTTQGSARPELVFRLSPRASAKVSRALGVPLAGESPDRTFLTLEVRLFRAWLISALVGDRGATALDLIWRRRF